MAVRDLTAAEQAAIKAYGDAWGKAYAAGDKAGMDAAHAGAEAVRAQAGFSGGADGSQKVALPSTSTGSGNKGGSSGGGGGTTSSTGKNVSTSSTTGTASWQPADTSGTNYDKIYMSPEDYATVESLRASWGSAENKDAIHAAVEALRNKYGYSGGEDGSQYIPLDVKDSAGDFSYPSAPTYKDSYSSRLDQMLNQILNRDDFTYNALNDPLYQQYSQQYQREGQRAMQDTLGQVSARTGGMASSYATSAAQQANNYYASQLADKIPELYQLAYSMYLDDIDLKVQDLGLLESASDRQYNRYRDTMKDWREDRDFAYGLFRDDIDDDRYKNEWAYKVGQDAISNQQWKDTFDRGVFESDRDYYYDTGRDDVDDGRYEKDDARNRVRDHIAMGGSAADLPEELIKASGYTPAELAAMEKTYADSKVETTKKTVPPPKAPIVDDDDDDDDDDVQVDPGDAVLNLNIGPRNDEFILALADAGAITEDENGNLHWANGWNEENYQSRLFALRNSAMNSPLAQGVLNNYQDWLSKYN